MLKRGELRDRQIAGENLNDASTHAAGSIEP